MTVFLPIQKAVAGNGFRLYGDGSTGFKSAAAGNGAAALRRNGKSDVKLLRRRTECEALSFLAVCIDYSEHIILILDKSAALRQNDIILYRFDIIKLEMAVIMQRCRGGDNRLFVHGDLFRPELQEAFGFDNRKTAARERYAAIRHPGHMPEFGCGIGEREYVCGTDIAVADTAVKLYPAHIKASRKVKFGGELRSLAASLHGKRLIGSAVVPRDGYRRAFTAYDELDIPFRDNNAARDGNRIKRERGGFRIPGIAVGFDCLAGMVAGNKV